MIYVGQHRTNDLDDNYIGCGVISTKSASEKYHFHRAVRKYGYVNFKREIIEFCETKEQLNEREIFWIKELNVTNNKIGYNSSRGGNGPNLEHHSEEHRRKNSEWRKGRFVGEKNHYFGKKHTSEIVLKMKRNRNRKSLYIIESDGRVILVKDAVGYAEENNLILTTLYYNNTKEESVRIRGRFIFYSSTSIEEIVDFLKYKLSIPRTTQTLVKFNSIQNQCRQAILNLERENIFVYENKYERRLA